MPRLRRLIALTALVAGSAFITATAMAEPPCERNTKEIGSYDDAIATITHLPDFIEWKASHSYPVAYGLGPNKQEQIGGHCYWQVPVYANQPERFELWQTFYTAANQKQIYIDDPARTDPIPIEEWRKHRSLQ